MMSAAENLFFKVFYLKSRFILEKAFIGQKMLLLRHQKKYKIMKMTKKITSIM